MLLSQTTEYALRAVAYLAEVGQAQNLHQIAEHTQVPEAYLAKVLRNDMGERRLDETMRRARGRHRARLAIHELVSLGRAVARPIEEIGHRHLRRGAPAWRFHAIHFT